MTASIEGARTVVDSYFGYKELIEVISVVSVEYAPFISHCVHNGMKMACRQYIIGKTLFTIVDQIAIDLYQSWIDSQRLNSISNMKGEEHGARVRISSEIFEDLRIPLEMRLNASKKYVEGGHNAMAICEINGCINLRSDVSLIPLVDLPLIPGYILLMLASRVDRPIIIMTEWGQLAFGCKLHESEQIKTTDLERAHIGKCSIDEGTFKTAMAVVNTNPTIPTNYECDRIINLANKLRIVAKYGSYLNL